MVKKSDKVLIVSANGYGNAGDDICAEAAKIIIRQATPEAEIKITSPPLDEDSVAWANFIVLGGGGIVYDANKDNMENYLQYVDRALKDNKLAVGIGLGEQGIVTKPGAKRYVKTFEAMDLVTFRSRADAKRLSDLGMNDGLAIPAQDLAFSYDYSSYAQLHKLKNLLSRAVYRRKPKLALVLSNQEHLVNDLKLAFSKKEKENALHFRELLEKNMSALTKKYRVTIVSQSRDDIELAERLTKEYDCKLHLYKDVSDLKKLLRMFALQDVVITQRFHGLIFSLMMGVPVIALGYHGQKQYKLLRDLQLENKLLQYHEPEKIKHFIENELQRSPSGLIGGKRALLLDETHRNFINATTDINHRRLQQVVAGGKSSYAFIDKIWPERYNVIAKLVGKDKKVLDVGAGEEYLKFWIAPKSYYAVDIHKCTPNTIVADLNKMPIPKIEDNLDVVVAQGLFEYLKHPQRVMEQVHDYANTFITTVYISDKKMKLWTNNFTKEEFEGLLEKAGWKIKETVKVPRTKQYVYLCEAGKK